MKSDLVGVAKRLATASRGVGTALLVLAVAACSRDQEQGVVIGVEGGVVKGPKGVEVVIEPGALKASAQFSVGRLDPEVDQTLGVEMLCGDAFLVNPTTIELSKPAVVRIPEPKECKGAALVVGVPGQTIWKAFPSKVEQGTRTALIPLLGVVGVAPLRLVPGQDTTLYVGSRLTSQLLDSQGRVVGEANTSLRTTNPELLAPDTLTGLQTAKALGHVTVEVGAPVIGVSDKAVGVRIVENPAATLNVLQGSQMRTSVGGNLPNAVIVEVKDGQNLALPDVWLDFFGLDYEGNYRRLGGGPTDSQGRFEFFWRVPGKAGRYQLEVQVSGTQVKQTVVAEVTEAAQES